MPQQLTMLLPKMYILYGKRRSSMVGTSASRLKGGQFISRLEEKICIFPLRELILGCDHQCLQLRTKLWFYHGSCNCAMLQVKFEVQIAFQTAKTI